ncbi:hypothetical protein HX882_25620 [Pseudomonas gingeri]|uniref:Ricin B lectin domain-containing protein n=1 Tax=Pseudomonas gingeri TaxID=117681 RepID=A0A7Y7XGS6_9PSED|nr:hypothetical protein [Pseudomonas gingeri]NWB99276.1 hypothetical protein [Pseudomonas gingeri]
MQDETTPSNGEASEQTPKGAPGGNMRVALGTYKIYSFQSYPGWLVDMSLSGGDERNVKLFQDNNEPESKWDITGEDNNYTYSLRNIKELRLRLTKTSHGSVVAYDWGQALSPRSRWSFRDAGNGFVYIVGAGEVVMEVKPPYTGNNTDIITTDYAGSAAQKFKLVRV